MIPVTVVVPAYNTAGSLTRCVASLAANLTGELEVLIIDDASSDNTLSVARRLSNDYPWVTVVSLSSNSGPGAAKNVAIERAQGKYVAFVDSDDWCAGARIERLYDLAEQFSADMVSDDCFLINEGADRPWSRIYREYRVGGPFPRRVELTEYLKSAWVLHPMVRTRFLRQHQLCFNESVRYGEDLLLYARMLLRGARWYVTDDPLYFHTTRVGSITRSHVVPYQLLCEMDVLVETMIQEGRSEFEVKLARDRSKRISYSIYKKQARYLLQRGRFRKMLGHMREVGPFMKYIPTDLVRLLRRNTIMLTRDVRGRAETSM
jgi:succinoglycan biosynthesis protein ExoO